uniref:MFS transporter n=1 Tax=Conchiformibius kuhniae TaxID=211502 RepID=A0A8T9MUV2_9NEIS|nr:MFS transporter [Conchiformibius kuhniae]
MSNLPRPLSDRQMAFLLAMLVAVMPFSVDAYLPALPQIAQDLRADIHYIEKSLGSFILGVAFGQLLGGSLADIKGRKNLAVAGLTVYMLGSAGLVLVQTAPQLLLLRVVQAVGAGMASVVVGAVVRDNYQGREAAQMFALIGIIMMAAPRSRR